MKKINVAVLCGGKSPEHKVSLSSAETVIDALNKNSEKYIVTPIYITEKGKWVYWQTGEGVDISPQMGIRDANGCGVDVVFPALHGEDGEDGVVQGLCRLLSTPCVGSGVLSSAICLDKPSAKRLTSFVQGLGQVRFADFDMREGVKFEEIRERVKKDVRFPCFVKPANAGSSLGISKAETENELKEAVDIAAKYHPVVMAEEMIVGRELEAGVLGNVMPIVSGVGEIVTKNGFYDYGTKYDKGGAEVIFSADLDENTKERVRGFALKVFRALKCSGMARIDFFLEDGTGRVVFNEVNTLPGFTPTSMFPGLFAEINIPIEKLVDKLVELAIEEGAKW